MVIQQTQTRLSLQTGDISLSRPALVTFLVQFDLPQGLVDLDLNGVHAGIVLEDWQSLAVQVQDRSLTRWQHDPGIPPPMGTAQMKRLVREINSTPVYQLFLAAFDLVELLRIESDSDRMARRFGLLSDFMMRNGRRGGLYFPPREVFESTSQDVLDTLVLNNKLCRFEISSERSERLFSYYVPYATPVGFSTSIDTEVESVWAKIGRLHRQAKNQLHQ